MTAANHFKKIFSAKNLRRIYTEKIRDSRAIGLDRVRPAALKSTLKTEVDTIRRKSFNGTYKFTAYKEKLISKGAARPPRVVSIPTARDRIVLRGLCDLLQEVFPEAVPTIPQVKIDALHTALASGAYAEFVKIDLQNFYPSIPHALLLKAVKKRIRKKQVVRLFTESLETPTVPASRGSAGSKPNAAGVPQGLAISNLLAEVALGEFDAAMRAKADIWYCRYVDDILVLCKGGASGALADEMVKTLKGLGLSPHAPDGPGSKSRVGKLTEEFSFLGYLVRDGELSIRPESVRKFEGSLASIFTAYRHRLSSAKTAADKSLALDVCKWRLNLRITGCIFNGQRLGWVFYFSQVTDTSRLRAVDSTIEALLSRFSLAGTLKPKTLVKTHYECKRHDKATHRYIPNFDTMGPAEKRTILSLFLRHAIVAKLSDKRVAELFKMRISAAVRELEADLVGAS